MTGFTVANYIRLCLAYTNGQLSLPMDACKTY